ncbi:MAG: hypothetical protein KU37_05725 [Sulfuricurvum sp. PC08-66]|nr:MAG: hypothetical protein KU37_05725 [Sulfuricurvum sp. PC08-66]
MAVGPVGGAIYVNQNMHVAAAKHNDILNRYDMQNVHAAASASEKDKIVQEVRPPEESHQIDPDRDGRPSQEQQKEDKSKELKPKEDKIEKQIVTTSMHLLDIKV